MRVKQTAYILALALIAASQCAALVVIDESFDSYASGGYIVGQGGWTGPFYQDGGDPRDTDGPEVVNAPNPPGGRRASWQCMPGSDVHSVTVTCVFPGEWMQGSAVMYIDVGMNATNGPGNFSYFQIFDSSGREATRIYLRRNSSVTGDIHVLGRQTPSSPDAYLPNIVWNPVNNQMYKLKLDIDITNKKYDVYVGDGDRSGVNAGHWGHLLENGTPVTDGVPAVDDIYFYYGATGLAKFTWLMYRRGDQFTGAAYALCDNIYIEGPDDAVGARRTEIWVAKGTYAEQVTLRESAHIFGGFAGTEVSRADRNGVGNTTVIDVSSLGFGARAVTGANIATVDGFTIRGDYGVDCADTRLNVSNNVITGCGQAGVLCAGGDPSITNNTIVNNGNGVSCSNGAPSVSNNIISLNTTGIFASGGSPALASNDVIGNGTDYSGLAPGGDDISESPMFVNEAGEDYRLKLGSPCIDAANVVGNLAFDCAGLFRPVDGDGDGIGAPDIGAYESQITPWALAVSAAKAVPGATIIRLDDAVVTAAWPDFFYVEADDRSCGIRVDKLGHGLLAGSRVDVVGELDTNPDGELYVAAALITPSGSGAVLPLALIGKFIGGADFNYSLEYGAGQRGTVAFTGAVGGGRVVRDINGLNNVGLLVKTWGRVTSTGTGYFYLDDGSGFDDGDPNASGVRVIVPAGVGVPTENDFVQVTGISSCYMMPDGLCRLIRVRTGDDIDGPL